jgi:hypothetical protein
MRNPLSFGWSPSRLAVNINLPSSAIGTSFNSSVPADVDIETAVALVTSLNHAWVVKNKSFPNQDYYVGYSRLDANSALNANAYSSIDSNAIVATAANLANTCNYNGNMVEIDDQICPMPTGGFFPGLMINPDGVLPKMAAWRGGVLQSSEKEIIVWLTQLFPNIDFYAIANRGVDACAKKIDNASYYCAGQDGAGPAPITPQ